MLDASLSLQLQLLHLLSPDVAFPRCGERMQRMHAGAGKRVEKNTAIGAPCKYCGTLEEQHPLFPSWDAPWTLFLS